MLRIKIFLTAILITLGFQACVHKQEKPFLDMPKVDKRTELLSIVFRLAERPEYSSKEFKLYTDRIERHFEEYKNHELIQFTKSIMDENEIGYDAVMLMAIHLDNNMKMLPDVKDIWHDLRWSKDNAEKFVSLLQKFYHDTNFDKFFKDNADLYTEAIKRYAPVYERLDLDWYRNFYGGEPTEPLLIILAPGNWVHSYGPHLEHIDGSKTIHSILGVWLFDDAGMPVFATDDYFPILLHEFIHSFVNTISEKHEDAFRESGEKLFSAVQNEMIGQSYPSWEAMVNEALVRASIVKYMKDHNFGASEIENEIKSQKERGFFWVEKLIEELENYDKQRNKYPALDSFMPQLVEPYKTWTDGI